MVYAGIDVSSKTNVCCILNEKGRHLRTLSFDNSTKGFNYFDKVIRNYGSKKYIKIGLETTGSISAGLKFLLDKNGFLYKEIMPDKISHFRLSKPHHTNRTDEIDARVIAEWLVVNKNVDYTRISNNELTPLTRAHIRQTKIHKSSVRTLTAILESTIFGITSLQGSFINTACGEFIINEWLLTGKINNLNEDDFLQINKLSKKRFGKEKFNKLLSLVKESPITYNETMLCATILAEVGDIKRFSSFNKFYAYTGLEPRRFETGDSVSHDKVSHEGSRHLRVVFYKNMQVIIKNNPEWYSDYKRKRANKETCVAYGHVIKKVLKSIYFITKNDVSYDPINAGGVKTHS